VRTVGSTFISEKWRQEETVENNNQKMAKRQLDASISVLEERRKSRLRDNEI
jgi:hypothetical protein